MLKRKAHLEKPSEMELKVSHWRQLCLVGGFLWYSFRKEVSALRHCSPYAPRSPSFTVTLQQHNHKNNHVTISLQTGNFCE